MRRSFKGLFLFLIIVVGLTSVAYGVNTLTRRLIGVQDLSMAAGGSGSAETFTYTTDSGLTLTLNKLDATYLKFRAAAIAGSVEDFALTFVNGVYSYTLKLKEIILKGPEIDARAYGTVGTQAAIIAALADIGSKQKTLVIYPSLTDTTTTWTLTADQTIPATVNLRVSKGAILSIASGKVLTIDGPLAAGPYQIFSCIGTGKVVFANGSVDQVNVNWFGTNTTPGATDMTLPVAQATNASQGKCPVKFTDSNYLITDTLPLTVYQYSWEGKRTERGTWAQLPADYYATTITFTPADTTKFMVSEYEATSSTLMIGPFEHRNLRFTIGDANGFEFGREALGVPVSPETQYYVYGVRFDNCDLNGTAADPTANPTLTRSGKKLLWITKGFECVIQDVSLRGCDTQIRSYGCDKLTLRNIRSQGSHIPFDLNPGSYLSVQHVIDNIQVEGWTFTPIKGFVPIAATNLRLEQVGSATGLGRYALSQTAVVTANSGTLTFSGDMTNILFPDLSLIELTDGTNVETCLVKTVSGTTVTVYANASASADTYCQTITWSAAAATVTRIHGYGPIQFCGHDSSYINVATDASTGCPAFVYVGNHGNLYVNGATAQSGSHDPVASLAIGNRLQGSGVLNQGMVFANCTPNIAGNTYHPYITVSNIRTNYGKGLYNTSNRSGTNDVDSLFKTTRKWCWTPHNTNTSAAGNSHRVPFVSVAGDTNSTQYFMSWLLNATYGSLYLGDAALLSSGSYIRIKVRAKAKTATAVLTAVFFDGTTDATAFTVNLVNTAWTLFEKTVAVPSQWKTSRTTYGIAGIYFGVGVAEEAYLAGVEIEEIPEGHGLPVRTAAPANPYVGQTCIADRATWDPCSVGSGGPYVVWCNKVSGGVTWARINAQ